MKEMKQRRKKERTWAEAARLVLENYSDGPMTPKQILQVIETEGLKEMSGTSPLACLNAMLHSNSRSCDGLFYKLPGRISLFTLKKDAVQWSRNLSAPEGEELDDTADAESSSSNEAASTVSGDNDVSLDETSSNASCSTEPQSKSVSAVRESQRAASQASKQKKKTGVMLPRVVLTPLKVNGAHMETSSGFTGRQAGGESSSGSSSTLCGSTVRGRTEIAREPPQLFRGFRKPSGGQMKRNRGDDIDFETPGSILVNTNLRALINSRTFNALPLPFQQQLLLLLPEVDRQAGADGLMRLSGSALNNEFFTHAAQSWRERLADGEFTHEMQVRIRQEMEKEKKTEQWKERFFEDYYGQKLGLAREEPQQKNSTPGDTDDKAAAAAASHKEPGRAQRGPVTRQRDGHFKKHSLRCRTRRSLYKLRESEQAEAAKEALSVEAESTDCKDTKPEAELCEGSRASLKTETPPEATRILSKAEDVMAVAAAAAARIPSLPQEPQDQESKEQKRKCSEQAASASFPEKKPRLEDRQSFRNTIESVHPEKPQPTKEEPKVPPIRIQLSRIKPPWVVKGQPTYQICPRIIPNSEPSSQDRTEAPTSADFKACAVQGRTQREAAAPAAAIGGGGGPGGGGRCTDEGGGGGGGGGRSSRIRPPSERPKCWRSKRTRGKCMPSVQRAQLLSPPHLEEEASSELAKASLPAWARAEAGSPTLEGNVAPEQAARRASLGAGGAIPLAESSGSSRLGGPGPELPLDGVAPETLVGSSGHLRSGLRSEPPPALASQGSHDEKEGRELPPSNPPSRSLLENCPMDLLGDPRRAEGLDGVVLSCVSAVKETGSSSCSTLDLPPESDEEERFAVSGSQVQEPPGSSRTVGTEELTQKVPVSSPQQLTTQWHGRERPGDEGEASPSSKPVPVSDGLNASQGSSVPKSLPPWEMLLGTRAEAAGQPAEAVPRTTPSSDDDTQSMVSETTETASEAELTDENAELSQDSSKAAQNGAAPHRDRLEQYNGIRSECFARTGARPRREDLPAEAGLTGLCPPQRWGLQPSLLPKACGPALPADLESQKRPLLSSPKPLPVEACNPLVVQLLKGGLPPETALPGSSLSGATAAAAASPNRPSAERSFAVGSKSCLSQKSLRDEGIDVSGTVRNGYCVPVSLRDSPKSQCAPGPVPMPVERLEKEPQGPEQSPPLTSTSNAPGQAVSTTRKPDASRLRGRGASSPHDSVDQKDVAAAAAPALPVAGGSPEKQLNAATGPRLPPGRTSLGPDQLSAEPVPKSHGARGKKVFGSGFAARAQHPGVPEPFPMAGMLSHSKLMLPPPKGAPLGAGLQPTREDGPPKSRAHGGGGAENKHVPASAGPVKRNVEKRKEASVGPAEFMEHLQSIPLVRGLPFFKLPREPGRGPAQPLEPSSIPSQLNIKQAFYGKLSKLQLHPAGLNHASNAPVFPRSLAESLMPLGHKMNFAASRGVSLSAQMFADSSTMEELALKCSCSLKAMIMCKGCGAFCHDDCIGPSKLCVLCLVVR